MKEKERIIADFKELLSLTKKYIEQEVERGVREIPAGRKWQIANCSKTTSDRAKRATSNKQNGRRAISDKPVEALERLKKEVEGCQGCPLWKSRNKVVFGKGNPNAKLLLVGEAPGRNEDLQGKPFVGAAGQLLTRILASIDLQREEVYITNILKCRPPMNRNPLPEEIKACWGYLDRQLKIMRPRIILAMGTFAARTLLQRNEGIGRLRGRFYPFAGGIRLIVTYHPAALLRNPGYKRLVWEDVKLLKKEYQEL